MKPQFHRITFDLTGIKRNEAKVIFEHVKKLVSSAKASRIEGGLLKFDGLMRELDSFLIERKDRPPEHRPPSSQLWISEEIRPKAVRCEVCNKPLKSTRSRLRKVGPQCEKRRNRLASGLSSS